MAATPEITDEPLWDRVTVLSTTSNLTLEFFKAPQSNADPYDSTNVPSKHIADTNMNQQGGRLGGDESFMAEEIAIAPDLGSAQADSEKLAKDSVVEFRTENDRTLVWRCPARFIPAGTGIHGSSAVTSAGVGLLGFPSPSARVRFKRPIYIARGEAFGVKYIFKAAPSLAADRKLTCILFGDHYMVPVVGAASAPT